MTALRNIPGVSEVTRSTEKEDIASYNVQSNGAEDLRETISGLIAQKGWGLLRLQPINMSLEEIFLSLTTTEAEKQ
jgi:ABC-2 type transport system ATP-binding protein